MSDHPFPPPQAARENPTQRPRCAGHCDANCDGRLVHCRMTRAVAGRINIQLADRIYQSDFLATWTARASGGLLN